MFADYNSDYEPTLTRGPGNWDHTLTEKKLSRTRPEHPASGPLTLCMLRFGQKHYWGVDTAL